MKHNKKKVIALLCAATMAMSATAFPVPCAAAGTKTAATDKSGKKEFVPQLVTNKLLKNKDIRYITNNVNLYAASVFGDKKLKMKKKLELAKKFNKEYKGFGMKWYIRYIISLEINES